MDYGQLAHIVGRADRTIDPQTVVDRWDRMGQFYASLESGHTTASVALQRLVSCTAKNHFCRANRDLGRVFKTEFLLSETDSVAHPYPPSQGRFGSAVRACLSPSDQRERVERSVKRGQHCPHSLGLNK
jgi:Tn3 transposase DDE domain